MLHTQAEFEGKQMNGTAGNAIEAASQFDRAETIREMQAAAFSMRAEPPALADSLRHAQSAFSDSLHRYLEL